VSHPRAIDDLQQLSDAVGALNPAGDAVDQA
jgi:hypothetical protein